MVVNGSKLSQAELDEIIEELKKIFPDWDEEDTVFVD